MGGEIGEGASRGRGWLAPLWVPGLLAALWGKSSSKADGVVLLVAVLGMGSSGTAQPPWGSAAAGLQLGTVRAALRVRGLPCLQHHGPVPEEDEETWERGEEAWVNPLEGQTAVESEPPSLPELLLHPITTPPTPCENPGALQRSPESQAHLGGS